MENEETANEVEITSMASREPSGRPPLPPVAQQKPALNSDYDELSAFGRITNFLNKGFHLAKPEYKIGLFQPNWCCAAALVVGRSLA